MSCVAELDERGLMPLDEARRWAALPAFGKSEGDQQWAALLSLADADEACEVATRWVWQHMPRGRDNTALVERYGAGILPWLRTRVNAGVLINAPWCVIPCLLALDELEVLELAWSLRGARDRVQMLAWTVVEAGEQAGDPGEEAALAEQLCSRWIAARPALALPWLVARAEHDARALAWLDARARAGGLGFLRELGEALGDADRARALFDRHGWPLTLDASTILAQLDAAAAERWPEFNLAFDGRQEYFALRVIAAREREGSGWGVVFERLSGSYPMSLFVVRFAFGSNLASGAEYEDIVNLDDLDIEPPEREDAHLFHGGVIRGPAGELRLDERLLDAWDLRPGKCTEFGYHPMRALAIRTYLHHAPGCLWPPVDAALAQLGLADPVALVVSDAFEHVIGPFQREGVPEQAWQINPSESPTFRSLAAAIVERDAARFEPGVPNTDWRLHAFVDEPVAPAWECARVDAAGFGERGWLRAAMAEAGLAGEAMPLAEARALVDAATCFEKGEASERAGVWVQGSDRLWAALLSLGDADEFARAMARLDWRQQPRGGDTLAPLERWGAGCLAWVRASVHEGVLQLAPRCMLANLLALDDAGVVDLLVELEGVAGDEGGSPTAALEQLRERWFAAHPLRALARLRARSREHAPSRALLRRWALLDPAITAALDDETLARLDVSRRLSLDHVLARLDLHAARPVSELDAWPRFVHGTSPHDEYLAMRVVVLRGAADTWAIVLERASGYGHQARVRRYAYGSGIGACGRRSELDRPLEWPLDALAHDEVDAAGERLAEPPDYWTGPDGARRVIAAQRSYLARWPAAAFDDPATLARALGLADARVLLSSTAFEHAAGPELAEGDERRAWHRLPSESPMLRSLAALLVDGEVERVELGASNLDHRLHTRFAPE